MSVHICKKNILGLLLLTLPFHAIVQVNIQVGGIKNRFQKEEKQSGQGVSSANSTQSDDTEELKKNTNVRAAEILFTKSFFPDFESAKSHAISQVSDGDSLWLHVKLEKPLKNYVYTQKITAEDGTVKTFSHFQLGIGPKGDVDDYQTERIWVGEHGEKIAGTENVIPAGFLEKTEFQLCLTAFRKYQCTPLFIALVGTGDAGVWENEIRFYRGVIDAGEENPALGKGLIVCALENGLPNYRKMWEMFNEVLEKGTAEENVLPQKSTFDDATLKNTIIKDLKSHGLVFNKVYFVSGWTDFTTQYDERYRQAQAVYTYKKDGRCFFGFVNATQNLAVLTGTWTPVKLEYVANGFPITCDKY